MMTGIVWAAVSSADQVENVSLENQIKMAQDHAAVHGVAITAVLIVPGKSRHVVLFNRAAETITGYRLDTNDMALLATKPLTDVLRTKPEVYPYAELLTMLEAAKPNSVVFFFLNRSRLGRTAALSMAIIGLCRENRVKAYDLESPPASLEITSSRDDAYLGAFKSTEAENQIWTIQDNHRKGMIRRVEKYGKMPGKVNWGYVPQFDGRTLTGYTINEDAATTICMFVDLYLDRGFGALNIADQLNRLGRAAPNGGLWSHSQITFMLRRIWRYAGYAELNVNSATGRPYVRARGNWPAIISEERAAAVVAEQKARSGARRSVHTVYRFTRMVHCAVCHSRFHSLTKYRDWTKADGSPGHYEHVAYKCPAEHTSIGEKKIMKALEAYIRRLDDADFRAEILAEPDIDPTIALNEQITALQSQLDSLKKSIAKADHDHYIAGTLDADRHQAIVAAIKQRVTTTTAEMTTLHDQLLDVQATADRADAIDDLRINGMDWLTHDDVRTANVWLRKHLRVWVEARQVVQIELL